MRRAAAVVFGVALVLKAQAREPSLQALVDATPPGGSLRPAAGTYAGPIVLRHPIRLDGRGEVTIDAGGHGSVVVVRTNGAELRGLHLVGSGSNHDRLDAGIQVRGNENRILDNVIEDCLFGIDLQRSDRNLIERNRIRSKPLGLGLRGDSIRIWYSFDNVVRGNSIADVRDMLVWYSERNRIVGNVIRRGRYGLHFMYAKRNEVEGNRFFGNSVGIFVMYSDDIRIRRNVIRASAGPTGIGLGFKESSNARVEENLIVGNARGVYLDVSPYQPGSTDLFVRNRIAFNAVGIHFHSDWHGNVFRDNDFEGNFTQVAVDGGGGALGNVWSGNHWDDYRGFDRDRDGRGDTPYLLYAWADRIWAEVPMAAFFRGSPLFEAIDFLSRLAPFSPPTLIVRDDSPRLRAVLEATAWER